MWYSLLGMRLLGCFLFFIQWNCEASNPVNIQGEVASVFVEAGVITSPCSIELESLDQTVELPPVSMSRLKKIGEYSDVTWFTINLRGCLAEGSGGTDDPDFQNRTWSSDDTVIAIRFDGVKESTNPNLFALKGSSNGVAIRLIDQRYIPVVPGIDGNPIITKTVRDKIIYGTEVVRTESELKPGSFKAVVNFVINYE